MRAEDVAGEGADNAGANGRGRPGGRWGAFAAMASDPQFQKLMAIQMKGRISQTYGALFKSLNLSPDQLAQFQGLLADKQQALMDVMQAAREQGINPRTDPDGFKTLANQAIAQTDQQIQQVLGDAGFQQYQQYQQTLPERNVVNSLQQQLSYSQTPLTDDEANQMIALLAQTQPQRAGNGTGGTTNGGDGRTRHHEPDQRRRKRTRDRRRHRAGPGRPFGAPGQRPPADPASAAGPATNPAANAFGKSG